MRALIVALTLGLAAVASTPALAFEEGDWVLGRWKGGDHWYPGVVKTVKKKRLSIQYDDGDAATEDMDNVRAYDWAVGGRVECNWKGSGTWYKGRIASLNGGSLRVSYDDGDKETTKTGMCRSR